MGALPAIRLGTRREPQFASASAPAQKGGADFSLAWPSPQLWGMFGGWTGNTGIPVTPLSALQVSTVYACVKAKSDDIGKLPLRLKRRLSGGGFEVDTRHPLNRLLRRPNRWQLPIEFWSYMTTALELRGNAYAAILRGQAGQPVSLIPLNPDRVAVLLSPKGWLYYNVSHPQVGDGVMLTGADMLHIRNLSVDGGYLGLSPIAVAQDTIGLSLAAQQHGATLFRQGAQLGGVLTSPNRLSKEAAERMAQNWRDTYGGVQNAHKVAVLEEGTKFEKVSMTNEDAQFLETRKFQVIDICRLFRTPPHKVFDLSDAHFSNIENSNQQYIDDGLQPICVRYEQACERTLLFDDERDDYVFEFDFRALLRGDRKSRYDAYAVGLLNGFLNRNEVRMEEGLNPIEGGDQFRVPLNTGDAGAKPTATAPTQPDQTAPAPDAAPPAPEDAGPVENVIGD